ncbi:MAG: MDR family MFS transporter [Paenibacillus macerans]|uniref:Drug resistance MFS transporter, drug:H+ antiporter-2 family protein n=1 Tax=Paenibacillus macerans TaxID=44252 RepID=A0A090ZL76_PAEMA|nr:MDR family MFS transporter [Paenibacillus macerans]KFN11153.1 drug resistance MFS transporter, drug:H+ antiporter-2 family protein [Paenibacillus macerans]MBS5911940.1 MFS transporter [Paenibacillus macerans]MCY7558917.1 MFS transporter [Paenibacillus macerans]MDU7472855.1 MDR family MFS transporter [Paenibacillus macerans]MEC0137994.1 MDR family MFS transporter [Paenibacillus macerans]
MASKTNVNMVVAGLLAAMFIGALDATVVATATPHMIKDLHGETLFSWVFAIYTLTTCVATPIFGKLADLFGRKPVFAAGIGLFVLGSILCGAAQSMTGLIGFRALQGFGAGALAPVCFTVIGDLFSGKQRGKMMGVFSSVWSVAGLLGPLIGGYFVDQVSWRWIFYINVPIGIIALLLVVVFLHQPIERQAKKIDYLGAIMFTIAFSALLYALLSGGSRHTWDSPVIVGLFAASAVCFMLFLWIEKRAEEPMIPLSIFRIRVLNVTNVSGFLTFSITTGLTVYSPIWIQSVLGNSATSSGLIAMPMSLAWPLASNIAGRLMYRVGVKASIVFGSSLVMAGSIWLIALQMNSPYVFWIGILVLIGLGMGFVATPSTVVVQSVVGWEKRGVANASSMLARALGQTVGIAVFGMIYNQYVTIIGSKTELTAGMHAVFLLMLGIAIANLLAVSFLPKHRQVMAQQHSA